MNNQIEPHQGFPDAPVHPLAALATLLLDNVFGAVELVDPLLLLLTSMSVGTICAVTVSLVQHYISKDEWGSAIAKGLVMGVIAGVPFQVGGTAVGGILLAWGGLHRWLKLPSGASQTHTPERRIIDGKSK